MPRLAKPIAVSLAAVAALIFAGCNEEPETGTEQLRAEQHDVKEAQENLEDARDDIAEQKEELKEARENIAEQTRELEQAEDAAGDAERQLAKEKSDVEAERTDADPVPSPQ